MTDDSSMIEILVADAMPLVGDALAVALDNCEDLHVSPARPISGLTAVETALHLKPNVVLIDYWMPDMEAAAAARLIVSREPDTKVIVMSWFHGVREIQNSLDAGAVGFFPKTLTVEQVAEGIRRAHAGESPVYLNELEEVFKNISKRGSQAAQAWNQLENLSTRELQILSFLGTDLTVEDIAKQLFISPQTVRVHIRNILSKTGTGSYKETVALARQCGLIRG